jgi:small subunit ribosomal protein S5
MSNNNQAISAKRVRSIDVELKDRLVAVQRVTKVTKGGRTFSFAAIVVVGNEKGIVGYGLGKAREVSDAVTKGIEDAKKNLVKVSIHKGTIPHEQHGKYSGSDVFIKPAAPGTGVIAGGAMRAVLESVGVKDVLAKSLGSSNPHNVVKATMNALMQLRDPRTVAALRNIDINKVFNG